MVGMPDKAIAKILAQREVFRHDCTHADVGWRPAAGGDPALDRASGTVVTPKVRAELMKRRRAG
jgi:hypothetical protein